MSTASMTDFRSHLTKCLPESIMKRLKCKVKNRDHSTDHKVKTKRADRPAVLFALAKTNTLACWPTTLGEAYPKAKYTDCLSYRNANSLVTSLDLHSHVCKNCDFIMALSAEQQLELQTQLQRAVIECNERCLYFAAKW